jgi:hypothetical protein
MKNTFNRSKPALQLLEQLKTRVSLGVLNVAPLLSFFNYTFFNNINSNPEEIEYEFNAELTLIE